MLDWEVREQSDDTVVVCLSGEMSGEDYWYPLKSFFHRQYLDDGVRDVAIDLTGVTVLDLEGVRALAQLSELAAKHGKQFRVLGSRGQVRNKLEMVGLRARLEHAAS